MDKITEYINSQWDKTVRFTPESKDTLIGLPYPYIVPCAANRFQELYSWDTYFGCRGLALSGRKELLLNNLKNFFYELETFGFIPNGSRTFYLNRSQPPFLGALIKLATELFPDDDELKKQSYMMLKKEVAFWSERRRDKAHRQDRR
jgi:alpha,alpha-trehalase